MKEMLGNLTDGQIEFYKSVCCLSLAENIIKLLTFLSTGFGRVGKNHTRNTTYTRGRLVAIGLFLFFLAIFLNYCIF
jgi:hypothetical protein